MSTNPPPGGYPQPVSDAAAARGCTPQPPQKRRSVLKIVLITAGALVLVVGGLIAWAAIDAVKTVRAKTFEA